MSYTHQLDRIATALEKLADDSVVEIEAGPPICPHCGKFDPEVVIDENKSECKLSDFIIEGLCLECGQTMYAVIESFSMHQTVQTVQDEIEARRAGTNGGKNV